MAAMASHAEFLVGVQPTTLPSGMSVDDALDAFDAEEDACLTVILCNEETHPTYNLFQFNIFVPSAFKFDSDGFIRPGDRMPARSGKPRLTMTTTKLANQPIAGYTGYQIVAQKKDGYPLTGESGQSLVKLYFSTAGVAEGVYPVYTSVAKFAEDSFTGDVNNDFATSYIRIGSADSEGSLSVKAQLPSFVNEALATDSKITSLDLTEATAVNGTFTYVDGREVVAPTADITADVQYVGNKTGYSSIKVPFAATTKTGHLYQFVEAGMNTATFEDATSVKANCTYLADGAVTLSATGAKIADVTTETNQSGMFIYENKFWYGQNLTVKPTRGLFDGVYGSNLRIVINGELTGINAAEIDGFNATSFDLQGRQVQSAKNGVFVVNGKKQIVK